MKRVCIICGQEFDAKSSRRSYCYKEHYHPCPICGKQVLTKDTYHLNECCCAKHSRELATNTIHARYEEWPCSTKDAATKRKQTCLDRYGVENPSYSDEIKFKISTNVKKAFAEHPEYQLKAQQTYFERTGYLNPMQNPEVKDKVKQASIDKYGVDNVFKLPEFRQKSKQTSLLKYGVEFPMQNKTIHAKQCSKKSSYRGCDGTPLDSSYEVLVYDYCIRNNIPIQRSYPIKYEYNGKNDTLFIDFVIDGFLVEVKGEHILDGYFDNQPGYTPIDTRLKLYSQHKVILVTGSSKSDLFSRSCGLHYSKNNSCNQLIGIDLGLFKQPQFPYKSDRPDCFYDTKVRHSKSCFDSFNDEKIRWDMIKNRIMYSGGFIDASKIVTALNVTKKGQQPSWFSYSFAKKLLNKYSHNRVIVDPFAGWGTRCRAATDLYRSYIGIDLNPRLVEWHQSVGNNVILQDAKEFNFEGSCDVFTCPPYSDTEIYFEGQDTSLSECDWISIIMKNIPNADKYIIVCKQVEEAFSQYVVDTKVNKSHFGTNTEYVLVIPNQTKDR